MCIYHNIYIQYIYTIYIYNIICIYIYMISIYIYDIIWIYMDSYRFTRVFPTRSHGIDGQNSMERPEIRARPLLVC